MKHLHLTLLSLLLLAGCGRQKTEAPGNRPPEVGGPPQKNVSLPEARRGFKTRLVRQESAGEPVPEPPAHLFRTVRYDSPAGKLAAYLTPDPRDGKKHPAIV